MMERKKRIITFITFLICTSCLALLTASLTTHKWIIVKPVRLTFINGSIIELNQHHNNLRRSKQVSEEDVSRQDSLLGLDRSFSVESKYNSSSDFTGSTNQVDETDSRKFRGTIYFGLFQGTKILNYGFGDRVSYLSSKLLLLQTSSISISISLSFFSIFFSFLLLLLLTSLSSSLSSYLPFFSFSHQLNNNTHNEYIRSLAFTKSRACVK